MERRSSEPGPAWLSGLWLGRLPDDPSYLPDDGVLRFWYKQGALRANFEGTTYTILPAPGGGHDAVSLAAAAQAVMDITGQDIDLDTQSANIVFAGPTSGGAAKPTFRALVVADLPGDLTHDEVTLEAAAAVLLALSEQALDLNTQAANVLFAGPVSGGAAKPTFRTLVDADHGHRTYAGGADHHVRITGVSGGVRESGGQNLAMGAVSDKQVLRRDGVTVAGMDALHEIQMILDGGGSVIATGRKLAVHVPFACTVLAWTLTADDPWDTNVSIVIDVDRYTYANYPTTGGSIAGSEKPTLSSAKKNQDLALGTWTTSLNQYDVLVADVESASTVTRASLSLLVKRT